MTRVHAVVVAIPARDEALRLPGALAAVQVAAARCGVPVVVVVAADACADGTAALAASLGATVVALDAGRVGAARDAAVRAGLVALAARAVEPAGVWVAGTDADSVVPADWLQVHLEHAERGIALLRGRALPHPAELSRAQRRTWDALNPRVEPHPHVHGANLGVTADTYLAVGGFRPLAGHEDVDLVRRVEAAGLPTASTDRAAVLTSARLVGRAEHGFAAYLRHRVAPVRPDVAPTV